MTHTADPEFWRLYRALPKDIRARADKSFALMRASPDHPSLRLKKVKGHSLLIDVGFDG